MLYFPYKMHRRDGKGKVSEAAGGEMTILLSDYPRLVVILAETIQKLPAEILNSEFRGRRNIW